MHGVITADQLYSCDCRVSAKPPLSSLRGLSVSSLSHVSSSWDISLQTPAGFRRVQKQLSGLPSKINIWQVGCEISNQRSQLSLGPRRWRPCYPTAPQWHHELLLLESWSRCVKKHSVSDSHFGFIPSLVWGCTRNVSKWIIYSGWDFVCLYVKIEIHSLQQISITKNLWTRCTLVKKISFQFTVTLWFAVDIHMISSTTLPLSGSEKNCVEFIFIWIQTDVARITNMPPSVPGNSFKTHIS